MMLNTFTFSLWTSYVYNQVIEMLLVFEQESLH